MAEPEDYGARDRPHIPIDAFREAEAYIFPARPQLRRQLRQDYAAHAVTLLDQLSVALGDVPPQGAEARLRVEGLKLGTIVEVATMPPAEGSRTKAVKVPPTLEFPTQEIVVLRSDRNEDRTESALLFVPDDARTYLRDRIIEYGRPNIGNQRRPHVDRFEVVESVRAAPIESLFVGGVDLASPDILWWELWVQEPSVRADRLAEMARAANLDVHADRLVFPDTTVVFVHAAVGALATFASRMPGAITEIRRATGTIEPFLERGDVEIGQHDWVAELTGRVTPPEEDAPAVCALDTGVSAAHPLLAPGLHGVWSYDAAWGTDDHAPQGGHGTALVSLVLYGDLEPLMNDGRAVTLHPCGRVYENSPSTRLPRDPAAELRRRDSGRSRVSRGRAARRRSEFLPGDLSH